MRHRDVLRRTVPEITRKGNGPQTDPTRMDFRRRTGVRDRLALSSAASIVPTRPHLTEGPRRADRMNVQRSASATARSAVGCMLLFGDLILVSQQPLKEVYELVFQRRPGVTAQ